jgi:hypothetical protein
MMPGEPGTILRLRVEGDGGAVLDTTVAPDGTVQVAVLEPGTYTYAVVDGGGEGVTSGHFDVTAHTEEMLPAPFAAGDVAAGPGTGAGSPPPGRPLRTMLWPYLLIIGLLCIEWVARRRAGLR